MANSEQGSGAPTRNEDEFVSLVLRCLDGVASSKEFAELEQGVLSDPSYRNMFTAICMRCSELDTAVSTRAFAFELLGDSKDTTNVEEALEEEHSTNVILHPQNVAPSANTPSVSVEGLLRRRKWQSSLATAAVVGFVLLLAKLAFFSGEPRLGDASEPIVAVIEECLHARGGDDREAILAGTVLHAGARISLSEGYLQLLMERGAQVLVESPSELQVLGDNSVHLVQGKLVATVPERAINFSVSSPVAEIVDLGTEFGVEVKAGSGVTTAAVFEGRVQMKELADRHREPRILELTAGRQARVFESGKLAAKDQVYESSSLSFSRTIPEPSYVASVLSRRPSLYHRFESIKGGRLTNLVGRDRYIGLAEGEIEVKPDGPWLKGVSDINHSLEVSGPGASVEIPSGLESLASSEAYSIMLWVRLHENATQNILLGTNEKGPEWNFGPQIRVREDGTIEHYLFCPPPTGSGRPMGWKYIQPSSTTLAINQWYHVAVTASSNGVMRLFIDGKQAARDMPIDHSIVTHYPKLIVGCSSGRFQETVHHMEYFSGSIDELAVFDRCLDASDIEQIYLSARTRKEDKL